MEQFTKLKMNRNLVPVFQIAEKIPENYCACLYLYIGQVWGLNVLWFKRYIQKCTLSHVVNNYADNYFAMTGHGQYGQWTDEERFIE